MAATEPQLKTVLDAAHDLLELRRHAMDTIDQWAALAKAVAACTGRCASDLLTRRDLEDVEQYDVAWDEAADGPLPDED